MTKRDLRRLLDLHGYVHCETIMLTTEEYREYYELKDEFEKWEPKGLTPERDIPVSVTSGGGAVSGGPLTPPNVATISTLICTCGRAWVGILPPPPCSVHGPVTTYRVTYGINSSG